MHGSRVSMSAHSAAGTAAHGATVKHRAAALVGVVTLLTACSSNKAPTASNPTTSVATAAAASTTSAAAQPATTQGGGADRSTRLPIPESAAIDAVTKDLTSSSAAEIIAKCNTYVTAFQANEVMPGNEAAVMKLLKDLADAVRPIEPAVADALAGHAGAAALWCKTKGFTKS